MRTLNLVFFMINVNYYKKTKRKKKKRKKKKTIALLLLYYCKYYNNHFTITAIAAEAKLFQGVII